ncbi:conserved Plasmodium protein, unknown function [Plasmodium relictum]|uniref:Uncharacterized protein n=1 Tax=Plasmodium relictum TaxID=85471 RepID=A0A1J1HAL3_PLARL|nr:conserved Plasmodium protein, unknown function [Plasmodium relictum]CRH02468.1 conserved Plasmodium protein, unknown function [Plasmodium relictum]
MIIPKVEIAFLIYNFECNKLRIYEKSEIIKELNRKINKYGNFSLQSSYKYVNNFSYTTKIFHYFFKLTEYYLFKYFNSIIVDSIFFFKCINDIKNNSFYDIQKEEMKNQFNINQNKDVEKNENINDYENKKISDNYYFDCKTLHLFIENLKRIHNKNNKKNVSKNNNNININKKNTTKKANTEKENKNVTEINPSEKLKFRKKFLYELCEINNFYNKKNIMVIITKIFRKIINRNKIRQFICENDKIKKKNYLKFFLNLSLGIFIYVYMYKYIKENYKNIEYFIFLNNLKNIRQVYFNNVPYLEKNQIVSFIKYIKFINIQMFQYIYISFFVSIYKYVNLIYNLTILSFFSYFKYLYEKNKEESLKKKDEPSEIKYSLKGIEIIKDEICKRKNDTNNEHKNYEHHDKSFRENIEIKENESFRYVRKENTKIETYKDANKITNYCTNKYSIGENKKREQGIYHILNENYNFKLNNLSKDTPLKQDYIYSVENKREYINELIYDCYIYVFIFFKYIRDVRKKMKSKIIKIQKHIKNMLSVFVKIYNFNKVKGEDRKNSLNRNLEKKDDYYGILENNDSINSYLDNALYFLYFNYIELSKSYKSCIKINYKIIKLVHMFHLLLKHFYKYFPVLNIKKENCTIYNYYNKSFIYNEKKRKKDNKKNLNERKENREGEDNFDVFKNVIAYQLEFFYFNEKKNHEEEIIHDLVESNEVESFDHIFNANVDTFFSFDDVKQFKVEGIGEMEREGKEGIKGGGKGEGIKGGGKEEEIEGRGKEGGEKREEKRGGEEERGEEKDRESGKGYGEESIERVLSNKMLYNSKKLFLYCLNNNLDNFLINVNKGNFSFGDNIVECQDRNDIKKKNKNYVSYIGKIKTINIEKEKNILQSQNKNKNLSLCDSAILNVLKNNMNVYNITIEIIENFCNRKLSFIENYIDDLNMYNKNVLEIYNDSIFGIHYKFEKEAPFESDELIKNRKLLEVKIFLDYEKIYTKKTVETQTQISLFKKDKSIQISKDKEVCTTSEQIIQTKEISNPIFYLKDIYD